MESIINWITTQDWLAWVGAVATMLGGLYAVCLLIPGDQPDKTIKWILDLTQKLSVKK